MFSIWFSQNSIDEIADFAMLGGLNTFETYSLKSALAVIIAVTAAEIFSTGYWQRTFSAMNEATIKKASIYSGLGVRGFIANCPSSDNHFFIYIVFIPLTPTFNYYIIQQLPYPSFSFLILILISPSQPFPN